MNYRILICAVVYLIVDYVGVKYLLCFSGICIGLMYFFVLRVSAYLWLVSELGVDYCLYLFVQ